MFTKIAGFEIRYQLRNPVFWVAAVIFFLLAFATVTVQQVQVGGAGGNIHKNSPYNIASVQLVFTLFFMFVSTAFVANVIVRDDETGFGPILRATRITKSAYVFGRFAGAFLVSALAFLAVPLAMWVGAHMPWVDPEQIGPNRFAFYVNPYLYLALPNLFLTAALFFALSTVTRSMMAAYLGVIAFLILWTIASVVLSRNPAYDVPSAYGEPLGFAAYTLITKYWTPVERNTLVPALSGVLLWNRLLAVGLGCGALALAYRLFRFETRPSRLARRRQAAAVTDDAPAVTASTGLLPAPRFDGRTAVVQFAARTRLEMGQLFRSPAYFILLAFGLLNAMASLTDLGELFGTPVIPVTRVVIELFAGSFGIIPFVIAIYYAGELVWRERDRKTHEIVDSSALPDWAFAVPKVLAVALVLLSTLAISVLGGMVMQLIHHYAHFELGKYFLWYVLPAAFDYTLLAILAVFVQALSPHKFIGWGIMVLYLVTRITLQNLGYGDALYNYARIPTVPLSDMNGQGRFWVGAWSFRFYWAACALLLVVLSHALWRRGTETRLRPRLRRLPRRLRGTAGIVAAAAALIFVALGTWNYLNTHIWNEHRTLPGDDRFTADYEKALLPFETVPQPLVTEVKAAIDIRPEIPAVQATGTLTLVNRAATPLQEVHVRLFDRNARFVQLEVAGAKLKRNFERFNYRAYRFDTPLAPGDKALLTFTTEYEQHGFRDTGNETRVVRNGTFIANTDFIPQIGMSRQGLLRDRIKRRKYGLTPELRAAKLEDLSATAHNYARVDWVTTDLTLTTDADMTPIAPGDRVSDVTTGNRRTTRFVTTAPILNFFSMQSARYLEKQQRHGDTNLEVYYDPRHPANVDRMLAAFAHGLDYYEPHFGPYQFHQARIVEFPAYEQFAQAFAGTMPYSEGIGFIADLSDPEQIDYVTYVVAHELGHQWWAHQVIGADMQGATMLSESLAQYSALMVMEHLYGRDQIRRFLKYELDRYLSGRTAEAVEEVPLDRVENQDYIHYRKGSVTMYRLKDELGEERVDAALKRFDEKFRFQGPPYPRSLDLIAEFRQGATPAEQDLITDLFERITLYDIKAKEATVRKLPDGQFETTLTVEARKLYVDGKGVETEAPMNENADIGLFTAMPGRGKFSAQDVLLMQRLPVHSGTQTFKLTTAARPAFAGADPYNIRIDRNSDDNVVTVKDF